QNQPMPQIIRKRFRHRGWPPSPAQILNQKSANLGIPKDSKRSENALVSDDARKFRGRNTFIDEVERIVPLFYDAVGQRLERWQPKPPKPVAPADLPITGDPATAPSATPPASTAPNDPPSAVPPPGNAHTDLIEIPSFLQRPRPNREPEATDDAPAADASWRRPYKW
ncbi:MAG: hypothetical protein AAF495_28670, partial [Pseudomonadota bacterium]